MLIITFFYTAYSWKCIVIVFYNHNLAIIHKYVVIILIITSVIDSDVQMVKQALDSCPVTCYRTVNPKQLYVMTTCVTGETHQSTEVFTILHDKT